MADAAHKYGNVATQRLPHYNVQVVMEHRRRQNQSRQDDHRAVHLPVRFELTVVGQGVSYAAAELFATLQDGGCVDEWLQDQLIIFMALAKGSLKCLTSLTLTHKLPFDLLLRKCRESSLKSQSL
jgi:hypothetical protein